jgi:hypothetical protein
MAPGWRRRHRLAALLLGAVLCAIAPGAGAYAAASPTGAAWEEVLRLTPWAQLRQYDPHADVVEREPGDVVVIYDERAPDQARRRGVLALAKVERHLVFVFLADLEALVRHPRGTRAYQVALGRVVAHELEHVRRGSRDHERSGWFVACLGREDLLSSWFGR